MTMGPIGQVVCTCRPSDVDSPAGCPVHRAWIDLANRIAPNGIPQCTCRTHENGITLHYGCPIHTPPQLEHDLFPERATRCTCRLIPPDILEVAQGCPVHNSQATDDRLDASALAAEALRDGAQGGIVPPWLANAGEASRFRPPNSNPVSSTRAVVRGIHVDIDVFVRGGHAGKLTVAGPDARALIELLHAQHAPHAVTALPETPPNAIHWAHASDEELQVAEDWLRTHGREHEAVKLQALRHVVPLMRELAFSMRAARGITRDHPESDGVALSACSPIVQKKWRAVTHMAAEYQISLLAEKLFPEDDEGPPLPDELKIARALPSQDDDTYDHAGEFHR